MTRKRKQSTDTKLHFGTVTGRYKPWKRDPTNKATKEKKLERKQIRIRRREKRQRLECNKANRRNDSTAGKQEGRKGAAGGNGKRTWKGGTTNKKDNVKGQREEKTEKHLRF